MSEKQAVKVGIALGLVLFVVVGVVHLIADYDRGHGPWFEFNKVYAFSYTFKSTTLMTGNSVKASTRTFVLTNGRTFTSPLSGPRGEQITIADPALPENTFKIVTRSSQQVRIGDVVFQNEHAYAEVHFNTRREEPQGVIPDLAPENK